MDKTAMFKLSYGLFVLSTNYKGKDNACIINTCMQTTDVPLSISITLSKNNFTTELIAKSGVFTVSVLDESVKFEIFKRFGFSSGRDGDKFSGMTNLVRSGNGVYRLSSMAAAYVDAKVVASHDLGTHIMFIAEVTDTDILSSVNSLTYAYYQSNIKPKPQLLSKQQYICSVCGYIYEGCQLPNDYICPICKHGSDVFTKNN